MCSAADGLFNAENGSDALDAIDAVLHRDDTGIRADQWRSLFGGLLGIPQFDSKQHDINRSNFSRIIGDVRFREMQIAEHAFNCEAMLGDCFAMRAACNEEHVVTP